MSIEDAYAKQTLRYNRSQDEVARLTALNDKLQASLAATKQQCLQYEQSVLELRLELGAWMTAAGGIINLPPGANNK